MAMKLVFTEDSPLDTTLIDETSRAVMYEVETERKFFGRILKATVIRKPFNDKQGGHTPNMSIEVARIKWATWSWLSDWIVYCGQEMKREDFIPDAGFLGRSFSIATNGKVYRWSTSQHLPRLVTNDSEKTLVAKLHEAQHSFSQHNAFLEVAPEGLTMLDQIVVSLVYVETTRRQRKRRRQNSGFGGGGGGGGGGC